MTVEPSNNRKYRWKLWFKTVVLYAAIIPTVIAFNHVYNYYGHIIQELHASTATIADLKTRVAQLEHAVGGNDDSTLGRQAFSLPLPSPVGDSKPSNRKVAELTVNPRPSDNDGASDIPENGKFTLIGNETPPASDSGKLKLIGEK